MADEEFFAEPPCFGRVLLSTTYGPLELELWSRECPKTCRRFLENCLAGIYDGTPVHRIVPDFCIQMGRPVINEDQFARNPQTAELRKPVPKEFHSRLKFVRRGLVGAVESSVDNASSNDDSLSDPSQFFITLGAAPELSSKLTAFGRVVGATLFNALRIGEVGVDEEERPVFSITIIEAKVLQNPFDGDVVSLRSLLMTPQSPAAKRPAVLARPGSMLSFGNAAAKTASSAKVPTTSPEVSKIEEEKRAKIEALKTQIAKAKADLEGPIRITFGDDKTSAEPQSAIEGNPALKPRLADLRKNYAGHAKVILGKRSRDTAEADSLDTMLALNSFCQKLKAERQSTKGDEKELEGTEMAVAALCKLHGLYNCKSCVDTFGKRNGDPGNADEDQRGTAWMSHRLVFDKTKIDHEIRRDLTNLVVLDPKAALDLARKKSFQ